MQNTCIAENKIDFLRLQECFSSEPQYVIVVMRQVQRISFDVSNASVSETNLKTPTIYGRCVTHFLEEGKGGAWSETQEQLSAGEGVVSKYYEIF